MDPGKVILMIPADVMVLEAIGAVAERLGVALRRAGLGDVLSCIELTFEPFTPESPEYGRTWHQVTLELASPLELRRAADLFVAAGAPFSSHVVYTLGCGCAVRPLAASDSACEPKRFRRMA